MKLYFVNVWRKCHICHQAINAFSSPFEKSYFPTQNVTLVVTNIHVGLFSYIFATMTQLTIWIVTSIIPCPCTLYLLSPVKRRDIGLSVSVRLSVRPPSTWGSLCTRVGYEGVELEPSNFIHV